MIRIYEMKRKKARNSVRKVFHMEHFVMRHPRKKIFQKFFLHFSELCIIFLITPDLEVIMMVAIYILMDILIVALIIALCCIISRSFKLKKERRRNIKRSVEHLKNKEIYERAEKEKVEQSYYGVGEYYPATNYVSKNISSSLPQGRKKNDAVARRLNEQAQKMNMRAGESMMYHSMTQNNNLNNMQ